MITEPDPSVLETFWQEASNNLGLKRAGPAGHFHFGNTVELANDLVDEILNGTKRATAGLVAEMAADGEELPEEGGHWIVVDGCGDPRLVIRMSEVRQAPFHTVDEAFAWDEGEGDRSLAWWQDAHLDDFRRSCRRIGIPCSTDLDVMFERYLPDLTYDADFPENWTKDVFHFGLASADEMVGCLQIRWLSGDEASLHLVAIEEQRRGQGLGRTMLLEGETFVRANGRRVLRVFAEPEAEGFYRRLGFEDGGDWALKPLGTRAMPLKKSLIT